MKNSKKITLSLCLSLLFSAVLVAQPRMNNKGVYVKVGTSSFSKSGNSAGDIAGSLKNAPGANAGFFIEKVKEDAKIGWKAEIGVKLQGLKADFDAQPVSNLPRTIASDYGLRANLANYLVYRPIQSLQIMFGVDPSIKLSNFQSIHFKNWGYSSFALGYIGAAQFAINDKIRIELSYSKDDLLPTIYKKQLVSLAAQQISVGVSYKLK